MKKILLLILLINSMSVFSQSLVKDDALNKYGGATYKLDTIVESEFKKEFLYSNALGWLSSSFKDSRKVIENKDSDLGEITFKGSTLGYIDVEIKKTKKKSTQVPTTVRLHFSGKIIVKDNKFRIIFNNLTYSYISDRLTGNLVPSDKTIIKDDEYNAKAFELLDKLNTSLINSMSKKSDSDF